MGKLLSGRSTVSRAGACGLSKFFTKSLPLEVLTDLYLFFGMLGHWADFMINGSIFCVSQIPGDFQVSHERTRVAASDQPRDQPHNGGIGGRATGERLFNLGIWLPGVAGLNLVYY